MYSGESLFGRTGFNQGTDFPIIQLGYGPARSTDQKLTCVRNIGIRAADKSVQRIKPVNQVGFDQEFERPINRWWCRFVTISVQALKNLVRANRLVTIPDQFENPFPLSGKSETPLLADSLRVLHRLLDATFVVVLIDRKSVA